MAGGFWGIITIIGPVVLLAALIWAVMNNRASRAQKQRTDAGTRELYAEEERETKRDEAV